MKGRLAHREVVNSAPPISAESRAPIDPRFLCVIAVLAIATSSLFITEAQAAGMPSLLIAALRLSFASMVLVPLALRTARPELRGLSRSQWILAIVSGALLAFHFATWIVSFEYTSLASSVVLVCTVPLWVALLAPLVVKEPITRAIGLGMLVAFGGGVVVGLSEGEALDTSGADQPLLGNALALVAALAAAGYFLIGRKLRGLMSLRLYVALTYGTAALILLACALLGGHEISGHPSAGYGWCLLLALVPQLIGHSTLNWALKFLNAATVSIIVLAEPVGTLVLAFIFYGSLPGWVKGCGCALILMGTYIASRGESAPRVPEE